MKGTIWSLTLEYNWVVIMGKGSRTQIQTGLESLHPNNELKKAKDCASWVQCWREEKKKNGMKESKWGFQILKALSQLSSIVVVETCRGTVFLHHTKFDNREGAPSTWTSNQELIITWAEFQWALEQIKHATTGLLEWIRLKLCLKSVEYAY